MRMRLRLWIVFAIMIALGGCEEVKKQAFAQCRLEAPSNDRVVRAHAIVVCMATRGYSSWCTNNLLCFKAERLDTELAENMF